MCIWLEYWRHVRCARIHGQENFTIQIYQMSHLTDVELAKNSEDMARSENQLFQKATRWSPIVSRGFQTIPLHPVFRHGPKPRKATLNFVMTVCPSVLVEHLCSNGRMYIKFDISLFIDKTCWEKYMYVCVCVCVCALIHLHSYACMNKHIPTANLMCGWPCIVIQCG